MGKTIGVISIKGGVGKTTTVANLGSVLSNEFEKKVLVVDANLSAPNLGMHLGLISPKVSIHDVLKDKVSVSEAVYEHPNGFHIIAGSLNPGKVDPLVLKKRISSIKDKYDVIVMDSSPLPDKEMLSVMAASDELIVVTSPDYPTLSCTMHAVKVAKKKGVKIKGLVLNKVRGKNFELTVEEIEEAAKVPVLAVIPDEVNVLEALSKMTASADHSPYGKVASEYKKLGACLLNKDYEEVGFVDKLKGWFK